jgi:hypothetical protein
LRDKLDNVFKLRRNRDEQRYRNIIGNFGAQEGYTAMIAGEIRKGTVALFPPGVALDPSKFDS